MLNDVLTDDLELLMQNLGKIRDQLKGDFDYKIKRLDEITSNRVEKSK